MFSIALTKFQEGGRFDTEKNLVSRSVIWFGAFLAFTNIFVAFGTMTNVSRYRNRNEEFRTEFMKKKLPRFEFSLFRLLSPSVRNQTNSNPFVKKLQTAFEDFKDSAKYYDVSFEEIEDLYKGMDVRSAESVEGFMEQIITYFIPDVYQNQVYLKDSLLEVYKVAAELVELLRDAERQGKSNDEERDVSEGKIVSILEKLPDFTSRIERTLLTGPIKYGFWRAGRGLSQSVVTSPFRYWISRLSNYAVIRGCGFPGNTVSARIKVCV